MEGNNGITTSSHHMIILRSKQYFCPKNDNHIFIYIPTHTIHLFSFQKLSQKKKKNQQKKKRKESLCLSLPPQVQFTDSGLGLRLKTPTSRSTEFPPLRVSIFRIYSLVSLFQSFSLSLSLSLSKKVILSL